MVQGRGRLHCGRSEACGCNRTAGGRGIRPVYHMDEIDQVLTEVRGPVFIMKCVEISRHIEMQLVGDGTVRAIAPRSATIKS